MPRAGLASAGCVVRVSRPCCSPVALLAYGRWRPLRAGRKGGAMKLYRQIALLVFALAALCTTGSAPGASPAACRATDAVFYTTDTVRLATELSKSASACADYYISISPLAGGVPRGGTALDPVHSP